MTTIITNMKTDTPQTPKPIKIDLDVNILEYLYICPLDDILSDSKLVDLILTNGFYKAAVCDGSGLEYLDITHNNKKYNLIKSPGKFNTLEILDPETKGTPKLIGVNIINR